MGAPSRYTHAKSRAMTAKAASTTKHRAEPSSASARWAHGARWGPRRPRGRPRYRWAARQEERAMQ
eukprot:6449134-Alexandrium_andersonii.AAC.1